MNTAIIKPDTQEVFEKIEQLTSSYQDVNTILHRLNEPDFNFFQHLHDYLFNIFQHEHEFQMQEIVKIAQQSQEGSQEEFDFLDTYSLNSSIFKKSIQIIFEALIENIYVYFNEGVIKAVDQIKNQANSMINNSNQHINEDQQPYQNKENTSQVQEQNIQTQNKQKSFQYDIQQQQQQIQDNNNLNNLPPLQYSESYKETEKNIQNLQQKLQQQQQELQFLEEQQKLLGEQRLPIPYNYHSALQDSVELANFLNNQTNNLYNQINYKPQDSKPKYNDNAEKTMNYLKKFTGNENLEQNKIIQSYIESQKYQDIQNKINLDQSQIEEIQTQLEYEKDKQTIIKQMQKDQENLQKLQLEQQEKQRQMEQQLIEEQQQAQLYQQQQKDQQETNENFDQNDQQQQEQEQNNQNIQNSQLSQQQQSPKSPQQQSSSNYSNLEMTEKQKLLLTKKIINDQYTFKPKQKSQQKQKLNKSQNQISQPKLSVDAYGTHKLHKSAYNAIHQIDINPFQNSQISHNNNINNNINNNKSFDQKKQQLNNSQQQFQYHNQISQIKKSQTDFISQLPQSFSMQGAVIGRAGKNLKDPKLLYPGVGQYDISHKQNKQYKQSFTKQQRQTIIAEATKQQQGPQDAYSYNPNIRYLSNGVRK